MRKVVIAGFHILFLLIVLWQLHVTITAYQANRLYLHDVGVIDYLIYHTSRGNFFYDVYDDMPGFAKHFQPSLLLFVPAHVLVRHILLLPIVQTLALGSSAWAVAWLTTMLVRRRTGQEGGRFNLSGMLAGWIFLSNPHVGSMFMAQHFDNMTVALGIWALAFLARGRRTVFWILLLLAFGMKEDGAAHWFAFAPWWLLFGWEANGEGFARGWRHRLPFSVKQATVCIAFALVAAATIMLTAYVYGHDLLFYASRYSSPEDSQRSLLEMILWPPLQMARLLLPYFAFLPLISPSTLLLILVPAYQMGLAEEAQQNLLYYYSYPFIPFLSLGMASGIARLRGSIQTIASKRHRRVILLSAAFLLFGFGCWMLVQPTRTDHLRRLPFQPQARHERIRQHLRQALPADASVVAQYDLFCQIPHRENIYPLMLRNIEKGQFLVLDVKGDVGNARPEMNRILAHLNEAMSSGRLRILINDDGFILLEITQRHEPQAADGN